MRPSRRIDHTATTLFQLDQQPNGLALSNGNATAAQLDPTWTQSATRRSTDVQDLFLARIVPTRPYMQLVYYPEDVFSATAARISAFNAFSSILSPSWKSMARLLLPSRLELKRPEGSSNEAPLAKVIFTTCLYFSPVQIIPACDHTGTPLHFHSSTTSGSACLMRIRTRASVSPRQSLSALILASIS